jgi:hypothetical protein
VGRGIGRGEDRRQPSAREQLGHARRDGGLADAALPHRHDDAVARLRELGLDILACPCGHRMKYVATIFDKKGLARLLRSKGLPHHLEPIRPARGPPQGEFDFGP